MQDASHGLILCAVGVDALKRALVSYLIIGWGLVQLNDGLHGAKVESGKWKVESGKWKARHVDLLVRERERERDGA